MKINGISGAVIRWFIFAYCVGGMSLAACSGDEQETKDPVEESSGEDEEATGDEYTEGYEEDGYGAEGYGAGDDYTEEVEQTAQEILNEANENAAVAEESTATTLEGIMNAGPGEAVPSDGATEYEDSYEEGELAASESGVDGSEAPLMTEPGDEMESLKNQELAGEETATETTKRGPANVDPISGESVVAPATIPNGTRAVMYVNVAKANVRQGPGTDTAVVGSLVKGERIVGTIEGDWARTSKGTYVAASLLTLNPVGRARPAGLWSSQSN